MKHEIKIEKSTQVFILEILEQLTKLVSGTIFWRGGK